MANSKFARWMSVAFVVGALSITITGAAVPAPDYVQIDIGGHVENQPWVDPRAPALQVEAALKREGIEHFQIVLGGSVFAYSRHGDKNVMCINSANAAVFCNVIGSAQLQLANAKEIKTYDITEAFDQPAICLVSATYNACKFVRKAESQPAAQ